MTPSPSLAAAAPVGRRRPSHAPALATIAGAVLLPSLVMLAWILVRNGGHLTYPLDAPYTQLALAEQIARGHYGLNPGEPSSPSSSIAWPFLLAALLFQPLGDAAPLLLSAWPRTSPRAACSTPWRSSAASGWTGCARPPSPRSRCRSRSR